MPPLEAPNELTVASPACETLAERLTRAGHAYDFFQAVWLLERAATGAAPVGQRGPAAREGVRFRPDVSLAFPGTDVARIGASTDAGGETKFVVEETFLGLYGVSTPLPLHYATDILRGVEAGGAAQRAGDAVRDFLDVFHHRLISLFYRCWLKYRYERAYSAPGRDVLTGFVRLLCGLPSGADEQTLGVPPLRLLRYAGTLTQHPRSAATLGGLLSDYWGELNVQVRQFVGQWLPVAAADQNRLGVLNSAPGRNLTVGEQIFDLGGSFRITVGPVDWETYLSFVPGGPRFQATRALTRLYCSDPLAFSLEVRIAAGEIPPLVLRSDGPAGALGMTTWVRTLEMGPTAVVFDASEPTPVRMGHVPATTRMAAA
jgi:type VI secretion system protein ImpH